MKNIFQSFLLAACLQAGAQHAVTFKINKRPAYTAPNGPLFVAGSFNNWKPDSAGFGTATNELTITLASGMYEYKFTRGSWQTGETATNGGALANRMAAIQNDTTILIDIMDWADHFQQPQHQSTASKNVHIIDTAFYMPQLDRYRRIWIYLPPGYAASRKKYNVLYLQDGQNVFDEKTAFAGEWGVDETLDMLPPHEQDWIVVAIDNGAEKRMTEYNPFDTEKWGRGEGDAYLAFIVKTLKPYIQKHYRVKRWRRHRAIAGSSMGGLISFYAMLRYPKVFGSAGVFSPAFWLAPPLKAAIAKKGKHVRGRIYFYAGKDEGESMVPDMMAAFGQLNRVSKAALTTVIRTGGEHNEARWRQEFPLFYKWLRH